MLFLSDLEILALLSPCGTILLYNWDALGTESVSLVHTELFTGTLKVLNHRIWMKDYCSTDKAYVQWKKEACPYWQKTYMQIYYPQLLCLNPRMLHVPLGVQVLVLTACGRYICTKKKTNHHYWLGKSRLWTLIFHGTYSHVEIL